MKAVLFYDAGEEYAPDVTVKEFENKEKMLDFINEKNIGQAVIAAYEYYKEIEIEPYEKVVNYKFK
jgi:hypothetical protein